VCEFLSAGKRDTIFEEAAFNDFHFQINLQIGKKIDIHIADVFFFGKFLYIKISNISMVYIIISIKNSSGIIVALRGLQDI